MKLTDYAKKIGIKYKTAWLHFNKGLIPGAYQLPTGTIIVPDPEPPKGVRVAIYGRVSSSENKGNLESQMERLRDYCAAKGYSVKKEVREIGSGINDERPKFQKLLQDTTITTIVVEHKDRATRFGFNYIQTLLETDNRRIEVINETDNENSELMEDLIAIVTSFVARYYGRRRSKRKTEKIIEELSDD